MSDLSNHTIDRVSFRVTERHYPRPIGWNAKVGPHGRSRKINTCTLTTDQGASGWGYCGPDEECRGFVGRSLTELLDLETGVRPEARVLDIALHDLAGTILGQPVWKMLGESTSSIPIYRADRLRLRWRTLEGVPGYLEGVDDSGYVIEDGVLRLPDAPGFGMTLLP